MAPELERVAGAIADVIRCGQPHDGSDQDDAVDQDAREYARAALAAVERPPENVRRIRHDGIPHGIRDACSECADVAWEECFLNGQCRNYVVPVERPPVAEGDITITAHESEWRNLVNLDEGATYAQSYLAKVLLDRIRRRLAGGGPPGQPPG